jgi:hypothetical protein
MRLALRQVAAGEDGSAVAKAPVLAGGVCWFLCVAVEKQLRNMFTRTFFAQGAAQRRQRSRHGTEAGEHGFHVRTVSTGYP